MRTIAQDASSAQGWQATLDLRFATSADQLRTDLTHRAHFGPLRVQKPLYPEGAGICHAVIVHPPGGIAGGDQLRVSVEVAPGAHALITTPGATKWYRSQGTPSRQTVRAQVAAGAVLEWLPQESIYFDQVEACNDVEINLEGDARLLYQDIVCLGRTHSGEAFLQGRVAQRTVVKQNGRVVLAEQGALEAQSDLLKAAIGMGGATVAGVLIGIGALPATALAACREVHAGLKLAGDNAGEQFGITRWVGRAGSVATTAVSPKPPALPGSMLQGAIVRYLGPSSERARAVLLASWQVLRPALLGVPAVVPRIWNT